MNLGERLMREATILERLHRVAGQSREARDKAIEQLNDDGYPDEEITDALRAEYERLEAQRKLIVGLGGTP